MIAPRPRPRRSGISGAAIRRPIGTIMLTSVVLVLGLYFLSGLPLDLLPRITYPQIRVAVNYPGVEPEVLEEMVARRLETTLATTENLSRIETEIQEGRVAIDLHFRYGTNVDFALQDASRNLDRARATLPTDIDPPTIFKFDPSQIPVYQVAFSSSDRDPIALRDWIEYRLRPQLLTIEGVASVDVAGGLLREVQVVLDQERIRSYGLTVGQVTAALRDGNVDVSAGRVTSSTREVVGKTAGRFTSVDQIRALPVPIAGGGRIPLSEVASVRDTHREQRLWTRLDGAPAVRVSVRKQPDANTVAIADGVSQRLESLQNTGFVPQDIAYRVTDNQADFIRGSVNSVRNAAVIGAALAMLVVFLFLGSVRKTLIIGSAIPIAILATFTLMGLGDLTLNIMTLGGLALGVGLLIDNSIVMLENIFRRYKEDGTDPETAAHEGAGEVQTAVIAATSTNLAAVVPFLLISGLAALIFRELILTISFAILASLTVALTLVPMLSAQLAKVRFSTGLDRSRLIRGFDRGMDGLRRAYRRAIGRTLRWRWAVLGVALLALVGTWTLVRGLGSEFLPQVDDGGVGIMVTLPPGASPAQTNELVMELEAMVREMPDVESVFATAGGFLFGATPSERTGRGSIDVRLVPVTQRSVGATEWVRTMQGRIDEQGFAGARIFVRPPRIRGLRTSTAGSDVALNIQGDDLGELQRLGDEVMARARDVDGLSNLQPSTEEASPQLAIELDRERASYLGLDAAAVGQTLRTAMDGAIATRYTEGNREFDVRVMLPRERFQSPEDVGAVALFPGANGSAPVYLRDVAFVNATLGPTTILRENQNRVLRITGDVLNEISSVGEVNQSIRGRLADMEMPDGYGVLYGGEEEAIRESNRQMGIVVMLAIFLVFVVLAVQYESLINPLVILLAIPLSLVGVGMGLWVTGTPLSAPVLLGVILLAGIVVNNAILLVQYAEDYRAQPGTSIEDAVIDAGAVRLRPILMTTMTTMCGMLPLALGLGQGSELMRPLAVAVVGGLSVSMLLTLFVVPSAYIIFNQTGDHLRTWLVGPPELAAEPAAALRPGERRPPVGRPMEVGGDD
jgi:hydrophobe/amphiphile efflux-1 (HAE1) family protein